MSNSLLSRALLCVTAILMLALISAPAFAQLQINAGEDVNIKFGFEGQFWADWSQDANTTGSQAYQQNLYMRRVRLIAGGQLAKDVTFFFETDQPNLGKTPKALNSGFLVQDAFIEWKVKNAFRLDGGLIIVPFARQAMQSTLSYYTIDISPLSTVNNSSTQSSALRDGGFQARGYLLNDRFQYRAGLFSGERDANAHDSLRTAGYVQYDFFAKETAYTFVGTALGKQKILAIDGGFDKQGAYRGWSGNIASDTPVNGGDEIGGQFQYLHYDGQTKFPTIADQNDYVTELDYYLHKAKIQPFGKFELQKFVADSQLKNDVNRVGLGSNYYVHNQNLKFTAQWFRAMPQNSPNKNSNEFTVQLQVFYF